MSKYGKALEKIQDGRQNETHSKKPANGTKIPASETANTSEGRVWDRGITNVKNTTIDNRVVTLRFPNSVIAEQYRMLRTSLKAQLEKEGARVILVSSSIHSEGKTITASNLAVSLAEDGQTKVALIDADLRRGKLAEYLGFGKNREGLSDFLVHDLHPKQVMVRNSMPNLAVMPRGKIAKRPSDLVSSNKFHWLLAELRSHFDYVIVDAPPIMSVADAGILGRQTDGVVFVIQVGRTPKSVIAHSHLLFKQAGVKILGYVLTNVEYQTADYRYYSKYYYQEEANEKGIRGKARRHLRQVGWNLKDVEERFNQWWDKRVLKKKSASHPAGESQPAEKILSEGESLE